MSVGEARHRIGHMSLTAYVTGYPARRLCTAVRVSTTVCNRHPAGSLPWLEHLCLVALPQCTLSSGQRDPLITDDAGELLCIVTIQSYCHNTELL